MHQQRKDPLEGATVEGRYVIHSRLARGGMSTVYLATDRRLDRRVALKVLYPHLAEEPGFIDRFEQEAKSAARLSHPHVVGVLDQGVDVIGEQDVAYLVMEFIEGRTLRDLLREQGRLTPRRALEVVEAVVEGLAAAHEAGLIHRDVKPENVLLSRTGQVKIADFGLARAVSASTGTATLVGTVAYLSPELVLGRPAEAQSDIYSTGIMLFELLTGRQPFTGDVPVQVALQHAQAVVPAPSTVVPGLAPDIDELVQWCTSRDPEDRPVDGSALLGELRHIRASLTAEELDLRVPGPAPSPEQDQLTVGVVPKVRAGDRPTEALPIDDASGTRTQTGGRTVPDDATRVIRRGDNETRVLGAIPDPPSTAPLTGRATERVMSRGGATARPGRSRVAGTRPPSKRQLDRQAQRPEKTLHGRTSRRSLRILVVLLVLLAGLVVAVGWLFGAGPAGVVSLPDVANTSLGQARAALDDEGLDSVSTSEVFDDDVAAGLVIGTDPSASSEIRRFERVELIVSKGPELFGVPDVVGRTSSDAATVLRAANLDTGSLEQEYSETIDAGVVLRQAPAQGAERRRGTGVDLVVSRGPAPIAVPDVRGLDEAEAVAALEDAGLRAEVRAAREYSRTVPADAVVAQSPENGSVQRGTTVTLTLSQGPRLIRVPNVFSLTESRAVAALEDAGFTVQVDYTFGSSVLGLVAGQSPTGEQPEGSTIRITVT